MNKKDAPLVYIVVLNYKGQEHLEYCLPSILTSDYPNFRVLMVDNASHDNSVSYVQDNFPQVEILESLKNTGWAGGNNQGIRYAREHGAKYVLLANNDIRVHQAWVTCAVQVAESHPLTACIGFQVFGAIRAAPLEDFEQACREWKGLTIEPTNMIDGLALFVRIEVFDRIGLIDEIYFAYAEEEDFERRVIAAGYKMLKINIPIWHYSQGTFGKYPLFSSRLAMRNKIRLSIKHEDFLDVIKTILIIAHIACNPFYKADFTNVTIKRLRPSNILVNAYLLTVALLWNVWNLSNTLQIRNRDYEKVEATRQNLFQEYRNNRI